MAVITFTPSSVAKAGRNNTRIRVAGEAIIQGGVYYIKSSDRKAYNAQCDGTAAEVDAIGIASTAATAAGQSFEGIESGDVDVGAVLTANTAYAVSRTAGKCIAHGELVQNDLVCILGWALSTSRLRMSRVNTGYTIP